MSKKRRPNYTRIPIKVTADGRQIREGDSLQIYPLPKEMLQAMHEVMVEQGLTTEKGNKTEVEEAK